MTFVSSEEKYTKREKKIVLVLGPLLKSTHRSKLHWTVCEDIKMKDKTNFAHVNDEMKVKPCRKAALSLNNLQYLFCDTKESIQLAPSAPPLSPSFIEIEPKTAYYPY